jgi:pimeloyl-ACP methyl ester carboxylesterase
MDAIGIPQAALAGHSMGGAIALHLAIFHPDRVSSLALISTAAKLEVSARLLELTQNPDNFREAIKTILQYSFSPQTPERLRQLAEARMTEVTWQTLHNDFIACQAFDLTEYLNQVDQPTLVICGEEDQMTPVRYSQLLATGIRGAHLEILPGLGHMAMLEEPKIVANLLGNIIRSL